MRRIVTASLTTLLLLAGLLFAVTVGASQRAAAASRTIHEGEQLRNFATDACLAADYKNIYNYNCSVYNQKWSTINMQSNGDFRLQNFATGQCLANLDYNNVYMTSCTSTEPGIWWHNDSAGGSNSFIINTHITRYLVTDYSKRIYLAGKVSNQYWSWQPPTSVSPVDCLTEWADNDDYVTDGWVNARVADINNVFLGCGDELSGIIHISDPDGTGTGHAITAGNQSAFINCFQNIARYGRVTPDKTTPKRQQYTFDYTSASHLSSSAIFFRDIAGRFVYSMYTTQYLPAQTNVTNDWSGCSSNFV